MKPLKLPPKVLGLNPGVLVRCRPIAVSSIDPEDAGTIATASTPINVLYATGRIMGQAVASRGLKGPVTKDKPDWGKAEHKFDGKRHPTLAIDEIELDNRRARGK